MAQKRQQTLKMNGTLLNPQGVIMSAARKVNEQAQGSMTRRELLKAAAVTGLGVGLGGSSFLAAGCGSGTSSSPAPTGSASAKRGGTLQLATDQLFPKDRLDPFKCVTDGNILVTGSVRDNLITYDPDFNFEPRLAETWESNSDYTEWIFHLRPDVVFHNGKPFTAEDPAAMLTRTLDAEAGSPLYGRLSGSLDVGGIEIVDDLTLKLNLKKADSLLLFPLALYSAGITPADDKNLDDGIGTGPFKLTSWKPGSNYRLDRNESYWDPERPFLDGVRGLQIAEASTKLQSVASGDSTLTDVDLASLPVVEQNPDLQSTVAYAVQMLNVVMDMTVKPFTDNRVREALKRSLDRQKLISIAYADQADISPDAPCPSTDPYFNSALEARTKVDIAAAEELMAAAGYPDGIDLTLKTWSDPLASTYALGIADAVKGSPFRIEIEQSPGATYWEQVWLKGDFYVSDWYRRHPVEAMNVMVQSDAAWNETKWQSEEMDRLLLECTSTSGDEQTAVIQEALMLMSQECGMLVPAYRNRVWVSKLGATVVPWPSPILNLREMSVG